MARSRKTQDCSDIMKSMAALNKEYDAFKEEEYIKTDLLTLDIVFGGKGVPRGKFIELCSPSGLGKSTLFLHMAKNLCAKGYKCIWIDSEGAASDSILSGVGVKEFLYSESNPEGNFFLFKASLYGDVEKILDTTLPSGDIDFVFIDSITSIIPDTRGDSIVTNKEAMSILQSRPGLNAQIMTLFLEKYTVSKIKLGTTFFFINQQRTKINITGMGAPTSTGAAGPNALGYSMDLRMELKNAGKIEETINTINGTEKVVIGSNVWVESSKSRFSAPFIKVPGVIYFGKGFSNLMTLTAFLKLKNTEVDGVKTKMLTQGGAYFTVSYGNKSEKLFGTQNLKTYLSDHYNEILAEFTDADFSLVQDETSVENKFEESEISSEDFGG